MSDDLLQLVTSKFFDFYRRDLETEIIDDSIVLSFPVHFSGFHRIEITVTRSNPNLFIISDGAKTLEELRNAGYAVESSLTRQIETITSQARIRRMNDYLVTESDADSLGASIQRFLEACKTIGDIYLLQRVSMPDMTLEELEPYAREWMRRIRANQPPPRKKVLRPCPHCGKQFGARELRQHKPLCRRIQKEKIA